MKYFRRYYSKRLADNFRRYLSEACLVILSDDLKNEMNAYRKRIKVKDLEQLTATKALGIKYLVSYDRDFKEFEEYTTPREFVKILGGPVVDTVY